MIYSAYILVIFLGFAAIFDLFRRRVPNYWTGIGAGIGMATPWLTSYGVSLTSAYLGGVLAFTCFLIPFLFGWMGAGDLKLFGATGLFLGLERVLTAALFISMIGGLLAILFLITHLVARLKKRMTSSNSSMGRGLPYAVAIYGGSVLTLMSRT